ncbi:M43 family zinc metalloprotease [Bacteroidota bacterium]
MTTKIQLIFLFVLLIFISNNNIGQSIPDYSTLQADFIDTIIINQTSEQNFIVIPVPTELSLNIYYTVNENGDSNITKNNIIQGINILNSAFEEIGITFSVLNLTKITNFNYCIIDSLPEKEEISIKFSEKNTINIYLVDEIILNSANYSGITYFPNKPEMNYIFLIKQDYNQTGLIHQMGHFFGLLHTHETINGMEYVNGENCKTTGDLICDTYADPDLLNKVEECKYMMYDYDANGEDYIPSVANYMSFSPQECKCYFTSEQYRRMLFYYRNYRNYLK